MTSPVDKVTWLQIITIVLVIVPSSVTFIIADRHENIPSTTTDTSLRNELSFRTSPDNRASGTVPSTTTQQDTSHPATIITSATNTATTRPNEITSTTNAHHQSTTNNYLAPSTHVPPSIFASPFSKFQQQLQLQQQQQHLDHTFKQTTGSSQNPAKSFSQPHNKAEPEFTTSELKSDLQTEFQEQRIRDRVKETFVALTKDMNLSPEFMFSLFLDLFDQFERISVESNDFLTTKNQENVSHADYDDDGVATAAYDDDDDNDDYYDRYPDDINSVSYDDHQGAEISSETETNANRESESESGFVEEREIERFDVDIHLSFNKLLKNLLEHFSKHQAQVTEEGHRIFLDFLYKIIDLYANQSSARSKSGHLPFYLHHHQHHHHHHDESAFGQNDFERLNDEVRMEFGHLLESIESSHKRQTAAASSATSSEIPKLDMFEDTHLLLSRIINVDEAGDGELNHCINRCINGWQQRKTTFNKKFSQVSEKFFKHRNISRENWDQLLVAIQSNTANHTNEVRECRYPLPEVHQISQYRYVLPENNSNVEDNSPTTTGGHREGRIVPDHVELYRCRHRYGCCNHYEDNHEVSRRCAGKNWTVVERVFEEVIVDVVDEEEKTISIPRLYKFINETKCYCKVVSKKNYNCTSSFEFLDEDPNNMICACNRHSTSYSTCRDISNGIRKLSDSDLRCIRLKECLIPSCVHGTFDFKEGLCPPTPQRSTMSSSREPT